MVNTQLLESERLKAEPFELQTLSETQGVQQREHPSMDQCAASVS